jgi:hypothetical protein
MIRAFLLRYAPHALLAIGVALLAAFAIHTFREQGRNEIRPQVAKLEQELATERFNRKRAEAASSAYAQELADLNSRPVRATPVRLCREAAPSVPAGNAAQGAVGSTAATGGDERAAGADLEAGPDIGPALRSLAMACDLENAKLRALQGWANGLD